MLKLKKGDNIQVIRGKDRGKKAKILEVLPESGRALVEGVNMVKKHRRRTREDQQGGIVSIERPISLANLMFFCKNCNAPVRIGFSLLKDGSKSRICRSCKEAI